jgi:virulence factor
MSETKMTRIGIVGIGDIAKKAYLPILCNLPDVEILPCTRNVDTLKEVMSKYHLRSGMTDLKELILEKPDMIFLCSATSAHFEQAKVIIESRIPLHIDKPVTLSYGETKILYDLAIQHNTRVMVGFNRRYVPMVREIADQGIPDLIIHQKNRMHHQGDQVRRMVFDDFIHVVDTCLYLLGEPLVSFKAKSKYKNGRQTMVVVDYLSEHSHAIGIMNYDNGVVEEVLEVMRHGEKKVVHQMETIETYQDNQLIVKTHSTWQPMLNKRGFEAMINHFIASVINDTPFDFPFEVSLRTHEVAEEIVRQCESQL